MDFLSCFRKKIVCCADLKVHFPQHALCRHDVWLASKNYMMYLSSKWTDGLKHLRMISDTKKLNTKKITLHSVWSLDIVVMRNFTVVFVLMETGVMVENLKQLGTNPRSTDLLKYLEGLVPVAHSSALGWIERLRHLILEPYIPFNHSSGKSLLTSCLLRVTWQ